MFPMPTFTSDVLTIRPWPDEVIDKLGFDPRSAYVERYWLSVLGPSTTWLLRRIAGGLDDHPDGFELDLFETARSLGLGDRNGRHSPFLRAVNRTIQFELAQVTGPMELAVRRHLPPLNRRQLARLSPASQESHRVWTERELAQPMEQHQHRRARQLALSLLELGEEPSDAERQLLRWRYPAAMASEAVRWANERRHTGMQSGDGRPTPALPLPYVRPTLQVDKTSA